MKPLLNIQNHSDYFLEKLFCPLENLIKLQQVYFYDIQTNLKKVH